jgi:hypothetical protein
MSKHNKKHKEHEQATEPLDPMEVIARRAFDAYQRLNSPEMQWVKQFEKDKQALKEAFKSGRNSPWSGKDWQVLFVQQQGKSKPTCARTDCGNLGLRNAMEWHFKCNRLVPAHSTHEIKAQVMVKP